MEKQSIRQLYKYNFNNKPSNKQLKLITRFIIEIGDEKYHTNLMNMDICI